MVKFKKAFIYWFIFYSPFQILSIFYSLYLILKKKYNLYNIKIFNDIFYFYFMFFFIGIVSFLNAYINNQSDLFNILFFLFFYFYPLIIILAILINSYFEYKLYFELNIKFAILQSIIVYLSMLYYGKIKLVDYARVQLAMLII